MSKDEVFSELGQYNNQYFRGPWGRRRRFVAYNFGWEDFNVSIAIIFMKLNQYPIGKESIALL